MNNSQLARTVTGVLIILFGITTLLSSFGLFDQWTIIEKWWPSLLIIAGLVTLLSNPKQYGWPLVIIVAGALLQLSALDVINFNVWQLFWPIVIILIGWSVITDKTGSGAVENHKDRDDSTVLLGGFETKNESDDYQGGKLSAIMGGGTLDLRHATIKKEATIDIFSIMGGFEIKVPEGWIVRSTVTPILGGVENKTLAHEKKNAPILYVTGTAIMSGVEIKH